MSNIKITTTNPDLYEQTLTNNGGTFTFDEKGSAQVSVEIAAASLGNPQLNIPNKKDMEAVREYQKKSVVVEDIPYVPGENVRIHCDEFKGISVVASDGLKVQFDAYGYAVAGINTANALKNVVPGVTILQEPKPEPKEEKPANKPSDKPKKNATNTDKPKGTKANENK